MGWLTVRRTEAQVPQPTPVPVGEKIGAYSEHTEDIRIPNQTQSPPKQQASSFLGKRYPIQDPSIPDAELPYIDPSVVTLLEQHWKKSTSTSEEVPAWIVISNIIYDCTSFQHSHPGGPTLIRSFVGQDCTWQFWRFHGKEHMEEFGRPLRIGRTSGIVNRFKEPPRYVGLGGLGDDDW